MRRGSRPLLAAALIVRDEAATISACLERLVDRVDEIVVYDTGSSDDTRRLARAAGARVLRGTWDDDFARARNAALAMTRARWVLSLDADERLVVEGDALRDLLRASAVSGGSFGSCGSSGSAVSSGSVGSSGPDGFAVRIRHVAPTGRELVAQDVVRLFRPDRASWHGRVHEVVRARTGSLRTASLPVALVRIDHQGYVDDAAIRVKAERNHGLARAELDALVAARSTDRPAIARVLFDLSRSLLALGRHQEAVDALETLRDIVPDGAYRAAGTVMLAQTLLHAGGLADAVLVLEAELRADRAADPQLCDWLRARALIELSRPGEAFALLVGIDHLVDPAGTVLPLAPVLAARARLADLLGLAPSPDPTSPGAASDSASASASASGSASPEGVPVQGGREVCRSTSV